MKNILVLLLAFFVVASCSAQKKSSNKAKKKIVLIPGKDSHGVGEHEHLGGCQLLAKLLNENVPGVTAVVTEQGWPVDTTVLDDADAILMYSDGGGGHMVIPHIAHMDRLMKKGVGLMNLHYAVEITKEYGQYFLDWVGGYFEMHYSVNPFWTAKFESFPKLPVTSGVKPFETRDEWYYHMRFRENDKNLVSILKLLPPKETLDREEGTHSNNPYVREDVLVKKIPQVLAWQYTRPNGGRGIGITGGHMHSNWANDEFRKLVLNSLCWIAKVKIPADGINSPTPTKSELDALQKKPKQ